MNKTEKIYLFAAYVKLLSTFLNYLIKHLSDDIISIGKKGHGPKK